MSEAHTAPLETPRESAAPGADWSWPTDEPEGELALARARDMMGRMWDGVALAADKDASRQNLPPSPTGRTRPA